MLGNILDNFFNVTNCTGALQRILIFYGLIIIDVPF
jgi:hypothetical protein